jgi:hypothetical protein
MRRIYANKWIFVIGTAVILMSVLFALCRVNGGGIGRLTDKHAWAPHRQYAYKAAQKSVAVDRAPDENGHRTTFGLGPNE